MAVRLGLFPHTRIVQVICGRFISAERLNATGGGRIEGAYRASLKYSVVSSLLPGGILVLAQYLPFLRCLRSRRSKKHWKESRSSRA